MEEFKEKQQLFSARHSQNFGHPGFPVHACQWKMND
jgi:hypothetical protein